MDRVQSHCTVHLAFVLHVGRSRPEQSTALVVHEGFAFHEKEARREKDRADKWKAKCQKLRDEAASIQASSAAAESTWRVHILPESVLQAHSSSMTCTMQEPA